MSKKDFLKIAKNIKVSSEIAKNPKKIISEFQKDKKFMKELNKTLVTVENNSEGKFICAISDVGYNTDHSYLFEFLVGAKNGAYTCKIIFSWEDKDFIITVCTDCSLLSKDPQNEFWPLFAKKTFLANNLKGAKKYFIDLIYDLAKVRIETNK
jgi:hypothetical protein